MKTPVQELYEFMEQNQYFIGNDLFAKYKEMIKKEKDAMVDFTYKCRNVMAADEFAISKWYDKTFNTKDQ